MNRAMGESQNRILEHLKRRGISTIPALAEDLELSVETVRTHLRSLGSEGLVQRSGTRRGGRGRPEILYGLTESAEAWFPNRESEILQKLAAYLEDAGQQALLREFFAGYVDERRSDAMARVADLKGNSRVREVARILSEAGFMAEAGEDAEGRTVLKLPHCPMRRLVDATKAPCRAELAFVRDLLGEQLTRVEYIPEGDAACCYAVTRGA